MTPSMFIISDINVKNNITTTVLHIWKKYKIIMKIVHYIMNVISTEAKIFAIRCCISQVSQTQGITYIVIITNAISATKRIFDTSLYPYQLHSIVIFNNLKKFFNKNSSNTISFWNCSSDNKWPPHLLVNKKLKFHKISSILPSKISWDFSRKEECDSIVKRWQMNFQASDYKGRDFLDLNNDDGNLICFYLKGRA